MIEAIVFVAAMHYITWRELQLTTSVIIVGIAFSIM